MLNSDTEVKSLLYNSKHENDVVASGVSTFPRTPHFACGLG